MAHIQLADGTKITDVRVWDGSKWISRIVKVNTSGGWVDLYRPIAFSDNAATVTGAARRSTTALIDSGFKFDAHLRYTVSKI